MKLFLLFICSSLSLNLHGGIFDWWKNKEAVVAYKSEKYDEALAMYNELMLKDPYNPEYNYNVGNILYRQKRYAEARDAFKRAVSYGANNKKLSEIATFGVGNSSYQLEEWQQAVDWYQQTLILDDKNERALHNLNLARAKLQEQQMRDKEEKKDKQDESKSEKQQDDTPCDKGDSGSEKDSSDGQKSDKKQQQDGQSGKKKDKDGALGDKQESGDEKDESESDKDGDKDLNEQTLQDKKDAQEKSDGKDQSKSQKKQDGKGEKQKSDELGSDQSHDSQAEKEGMKEEQNDFKDGQEVPFAYKKPELKNQLQEKFESKSSQDERLDDHYATIVDVLESRENSIQKAIVKQKVSKMTAGQHGKNGW